ncbi:MAG TPA: peptidoglycan-binding domain-containing protein [Xanthobacteraceae bacterium]
MRNRRNRRQTFSSRAASAGGALVVEAWSRIARRPVDAIAILAAVGASFIVIVNAAFLQSGMHPLPTFETTSKPSDRRSDSFKLIASRPTIAGGPVHPATASNVSLPEKPASPARHNDPIADLINPSARIAAVQRALSEYGYGQIKPSGTLDDATTAAIEKFEREHNLPITGRISDRLVSELTAMIGHPIE